MVNKQLPTYDDIDACVLDFDGCLVRGISKVYVAWLMGTAVLLRPHRPEDRRYLVRLGLAGLALYACRLGQKATGQLSDADLVRLYARLLAPLPPEYFRQAARRIPARFFPGVETAFQWLAERWPVGVVSLALADVLEAADSYLATRTGCRFAFIAGNHLEHLRLGTQSASAILTAEDKRSAMAIELTRLGCQRPLVIGHDREDLGLVHLAREMGGLSLGVNPAPQIADQFDLTLCTGDWSAVVAFLQQTLAPPALEPKQPN
jgi:phosphoserine phosphatase